MKEIQTRQEFNFVRIEAHPQRHQVADVMAKVNLVGKAGKVGTFQYLTMVPNLTIV